MGGPRYYGIQHRQAHLTLSQFFTTYNEGANVVRMLLLDRLSRSRRGNSVLACNGIDKDGIL